MDQTEPGGRYLVGGKLVDAEGKELEGVKAEAAAGDSDSLPEDFPGREALAAGGFTTRTSVAGASDEDLDKVPGIGPATLKDIRKALK